MSIVSLKINNETKAGKALLAVIEFFKNQKGIELVNISVNEDGPYNLEFVKMVLDAAKEKGGREIDPKNLWESIK